MSGAVSTGNIGLVKFLLAMGKSFPEYSIDLACKSGRLEMLKYLRSIGENASWKAIGYAVDRGKLDVVKYLCSTFDIEDIYWEYHSAVSSKKHDIVEYFDSIGLGERKIDITYTL